MSAMVSPISSPVAQTSSGLDAHHPTLWGLTPTQLHDRFWAARGVQVVRLGERSQIIEAAELYLLTDPRTLTIFRLRHVIDQLSWMKPDLMVIRLHDTHEHGYREMVIKDHEDRFVRFVRSYGGSDSRLGRVALTPDAEIAKYWQAAPDSRTAWRKLRFMIPHRLRCTASVNGLVFDRATDSEVMQFTRDLIRTWSRPDMTIEGLHRVGSKVWALGRDRPQPGVGYVGQIWVGAGRQLTQDTSVVGPAVVWDDPQARPVVDDISWQDIEPAPSYDRPVPPRDRSSLERAFKRGFDMCFAMMVLLLTLPLYPLIMLAIWLEDGRPFFFAHRRETVGGREFPCIKFRSMRRNSDEIKKKLMEQNQADGPQFFIDPENDPRLTRVGNILRKTNLDELPQFINVLMGDMSVVGPRPSPFSENQFCPAWREARLSVRPGITGLWQVRRSRRKGLDFQEWIKYDLEYVQKGGLWMDLAIIRDTIGVILRGIFHV